MTIKDSDFELAQGFMNKTESQMATSPPRLVSLGMCMLMYIKILRGVDSHIH